MMGLTNFRGLTGTWTNLVILSLLLSVTAAKFVPQCTPNKPVQIRQVCLNLSTFKGTVKNAESKDGVTVFVKFAGLQQMTFELNDFQYHSKNSDCQNAYKKFDRVPELQSAYISHRRISSGTDGLLVKKLELTIKDNNYNEVFYNSLRLQGGAP